MVFLDLLRETLRDPFFDILRDPFLDILRETFLEPLRETLRGDFLEYFDFAIL